MNILIISGHPDLKTSVANTVIMEEFEKAFPEADIRYLDRLYSGKAIDVPAEQAALKKADLILWQFPFYWYSVPGLMKTWIDEVFLHGFAHGSTAVLGGKKLLLSFTTGAPEAAYTDEIMGTLPVLTKPFESLAKLCRLDYLGYEALTGVSYITRTDEAAVKAQQDMARDYAKKVIALIKAL